jgi:hypothetical protein
MRIHSFGLIVLLCTVIPASLATAADSDKTLAERMFGNADKNDDGSLDDKEVPEAKRIFKSAIFEKKKADELPGGKNTFEKIEDAATQGKVDDNKDGKVTQQEWLGYVKDAFNKKEAILKDAREKIAAAKKKQDDQAKIDRLRREKEQLAKKLKQKKKK